MDVKSYISSGILEDYILGQASDQERREVECMSHIYPEIKQELSRFESAMEGYAFSHQTTPPPTLKDKIFKQVEEIEEQQKKKQGPESKIISINDAGNNVKTESAKTGYLKLAVAASVSILIATGLFSYNLYRNYVGQKQQITNITEERNAVSASLSSLQENLNNTEEELAVVKDPNNIKVLLKGLENKAPDGLTSVYFNPSDNSVYLSLNNLPEPPSGKQYQLWAIVEGQPVDMGVFEYRLETLQKMKQVENPQAFAVTLEKKGGSPSPTMEEMFVLGKV
ncbi:MAG: anti-sigma factor [Bacteroidetes bacterium]|nr:anti-sigma factor [Bacteroidota bacterium]